MTTPQSILVLGPNSNMRWPELLTDACQTLGIQADILYCYQKPWYLRLLKPFSKFFQASEHTQLFSGYRWLYRRQLKRTLSQHQPDILVFIQRELPDDILDAYKQQHPTARYYYWWGDIIPETKWPQIIDAGKIADGILISYYGSYRAAKDKLIKAKPIYFPFAYSPTRHALPPISEDELVQFRCDLLFVGAYYPERAAIMEHIIDAIPAITLQIRGVGWDKYQGKLKPYIHGTTLVTLADTLKMYHCATLSLNIHHKATQNGFNMRFFEIPAAGGLQITEWQPAIERTALANCTVTFKTHEELIDKITYFLTHHDERTQLRTRSQLQCHLHETYENRLNLLINDALKSQPDAADSTPSSHQ